MTAHLWEAIFNIVDDFGVGAEGVVVLKVVDGFGKDLLPSLLRIHLCH